MTGPSSVATPLVAADVVAAVDAVGGQVHGLLDGLRSAGGRAVRRPPIVRRSPSWASTTSPRRMLRLPDLPLAGAGFVAAQDALADVPYWLQWWTTDPDAAQPAVERLQVQTDPSAEDFRDYTGLAWFTGPRDTGEPCLTGPYVDYLCTDEYTLTFTQPVQTAVGLVGVVGADLFVRALEARVLPALARLDTPGRPGERHRAGGHRVRHRLGHRRPGPRRAGQPLDARGDGRRPTRGGCTAAPPCRSPSCSPPPAAPPPAPVRYPGHGHADRGTSAVR